MLDSLTLPSLPTLHGERVILRGPSRDWRPGGFCALSNRPVIAA